MSDSGPPSAASRRSGGGPRRWVAASVAVAIGLTFVSALAYGIVAHPTVSSDPPSWTLPFGGMFPLPSPPGPGPGGHSGTTPSPYYDNVTYVEWDAVNQTVLTMTPVGVNVSQGQTFTVSVVLHCGAGESACPGDHVTRAAYANGLGTWPPGVSPCGLFRSTFNITGSNLPQTISSSGTVVIQLTLQAPVVTYPNLTTHVLQPFDYTAHVQVLLLFS